MSIVAAFAAELFGTSMSTEMLRASRPVDLECRQKEEGVEPAMFLWTSLCQTSSVVEAVTTQINDSPDLKPRCLLACQHSTHIQAC